MRPGAGPASRKRWWLVTAAYAAALLVASLAPVGLPKEAPEHLDKVVHVCEYLLFAWLLVHALRASALEERRAMVRAWLIATAYGALMEVLQGFTSWRSMDIFDAAANALGAALGVWLSQRVPKRPS